MSHVVVGTEVHTEIIGLVDRAQEFVVLVSPFVRIWPEFYRALARAIVREVDVSMYVRGPVDAPDGHCLAMLADLDIEPCFVPNLHLKAYVSDVEALHSSANLTASSVGRAVESAMRFVRGQDAQGWASVFEVWQQVEDDLNRLEQDSDSESRMIQPWGDALRVLADNADPYARSMHRYCIGCGATASETGGWVVCTHCRARTVASDKRLDAFVGARCAECGGQCRGATPDRPRCRACFSERTGARSRKDPSWFAEGALGTIRVWSDRLPHPPMFRDEDKYSSAVPRRWNALMGDPELLSVHVAAGTKKIRNLVDVALPPEEVSVDGMAAVSIERFSRSGVPKCPAMGAVVPKFHMVYSHRADVDAFDHWEPGLILAAWDFATSVDLAEGVPKGLWLRLILASRRALASGEAMSPSTACLAVEMALSGPPARRLEREPCLDSGVRDWRTVASHLISPIFSSLHSYEAVDLMPLLQGVKPEIAQAIVDNLTTTAPLGPASLQTDRKGRLLPWPARTDRLAAIRVTYTEGETWAVKARIMRALPRSVH